MHVPGHNQFVNVTHTILSMNEFSVKIDEVLNFLSRNAMGLCDVIIHGLLVYIYISPEQHTMGELL